MLPVLQESGTGSGQADSSYLQAQPSPHQEGSAGGLNQDRAFLASHFPPALRGSLPGSQQSVGSLGHAHSMPSRTQSPRQQLPASPAPATHSESPAPGSMQGGGGLRAGNADMVVRTHRAGQRQQQQQQAQVFDEEPDVPGPESDQEEGESEVAGLQTPAADADLEAAIDALDADAGLQGAASHSLPLPPSLGGRRPFHLASTAPAFLPLEEHLSTRV